LKKEKKIKKIVVAGCLSQRYGEELIPELREVDAFIGRLALDNNSPNGSVRLTPRHFAYVKISEGCVNNCSYCVIPKIKGPHKSRSIESIVKEVSELDRKGVSEINIVGQDTTAYGFDLYRNFKIVELLKEILSVIKKIRWVRLLYTHPNHITDELIDLIAKSDKLCNYIDLPIQHINNRILKLMNRNITKEKVNSLVKKIRRNIPDVALRTSIIVGFPSETEDEFKELLDFIEEVKFERLGAFLYSHEEDTKAFNFDGQISKEQKERRFDILMQKQQEISTVVQEKFQGKTLDILVDEKLEGRRNTYLGRSYADAPEVDGQVFINTKKTLKPGQFVEVKIKDTLEYDLVGGLINEPSE
jgi:ribosomal protein S12 methylthiotransferase